MKGWVAVTSLKGGALHLKFLSCDLSCAVANNVEKNRKCFYTQVFLGIADLIGIDQSISNQKITRNTNLGGLHFLWQVVRNYHFVQSQEKPHKKVNCALPYRLVTATHSFTYSLHMGQIYQGAYSAKNWSFLG